MHQLPWVSRSEVRKGVQLSGLPHACCGDVRRLSRECRLYEAVWDSDGSGTEVQPKRPRGRIAQETRSIRTDMQRLSWQSWRGAAGHDGGRECLRYLSRP